MEPACLAVRFMSRPFPIPEPKLMILKRPCPAGPATPPGRYGTRRPLHPGPGTYPGPGHRTQPAAQPGTPTTGRSSHPRRSHHLYRPRRTGAGGRTRGPLPRRCPDRQALRSHRPRPSGRTATTHRGRSTPAATTPTAPDQTDWVITQYHAGATLRTLAEHPQNPPANRNHPATTRHPHHQATPPEPREPESRTGKPPRGAHRRAPQARVFTALG